jgi:hypothetical protein
MCKRKDPADPLVRRFLKTYNVNLLPLPRRRAFPGELYIQSDRKVKATSGSINEVVEPDVVLPRAFSEPLPDLSGVASQAVEADLGLGLLANFLVAAGVPPGVVDEVRLGYRRSATARVAFEFSGVTRDSIDPFSIGTALIDHRLKRHPWVQPDSRYYVAAGFVRAPSISIHAHDGRRHAVELGAGVLTALEGSVAVSTERAGEGVLSYRGDESLAIGVELYELRYDEQDGFRMGGQRQPVGLMRGRDIPPAADFPAEDDEALLVVEDLEPSPAAP